MQAAPAALVGSYRQTSGTHSEQLRLRPDERVESVFRASVMRRNKTDEAGTWRVSGDTLLVTRTRDARLSELGFPKQDLFIIDGRRLYESARNHEGELFSTPHHFERRFALDLW